MARRAVLLVAATLVAAVGTLLIYLYVRSVDERATTDQSLVRVLVAAKNIPAGLPGARVNSGGYVEIREVRRSDVVSGALSDLAGVLDQVTVAPVFAGQQIIQAQFGAAKTADDVRVGAGKLTMSIRLDDSARVAGLITPGSWVSVFVSTTSGSGTAQRDITQMLLPRVQVFDVGESATSPASTDGQRARSTARTGATDIVSLIVDPEEAKKLVFAQRKGQLYLALIGSPTTTPTAGPPVDDSNLLLPQVVR